MNQWYPVYTRPRAEKKAFEALRSKNIEAYLPIRKQLKQWSDRKKWIDEPLIPSYIFVFTHPIQHANVLSTQGICRFLYFSGKIAIMPVQQIEQLKLLMAVETDLEIVDHAFQKGEQVIVKAGPLQGLKGEMVSFHSKKKLVISIEHTGRAVLVQVPQAFLEPLK